MIKLLLVDDEVTTRKGLIRHVAWKALGVDRVEEAADGEEALEKIKSFEPDIIITDIKMPNMDGITLSTVIKEKIPDCKIIYISGYSDKEYMKAAIKINVLDYIDKPVNLNEIENSIKKAVTLCKEDRRKKQEMKSLRQDRISLLRQTLLKESLLGSISAKRLQRVMQTLQFSVSPETTYSVMLFRVLPAYAISKNQFQTITSDLLFAVDKIFACSQKITGSLQEQTVGMLLLGSANTCVYDLPTVQYNIEKLLTKARCSEFSCFIAVGTAVTGAENIPASYQSACEQMETNIFFGNMQSRTDKNKIEDSLFEKKILQQYASLTQVEREEEATLLIHKLFSEIAETRPKIKTAKNILFKLMHSLFNEAQCRGIYLLEDMGNKREFLWEIVSNSQTLTAIQEFFQQKIALLFQKEENLSIYNRTVLEAIRYIQKHYGCIDLSAQKIAEHLYLTPSYFSKLFKQVTRKNISTYITEYRIEKSKEFLLDEENKLYHIAEQIGYSDPNYYTKIFKKITGITPSEYRKKRMEWQEKQ